MDIIMKYCCCDWKYWKYT